MFRFLAIILVAVFAVTATVETTTAQDRDRVIFVNAPSAGALNLRTGPGTSYPIILSMRHGTRLLALGRAGDWIRVRHPNGAVGYAYRSYLRQRPPRF